jgi:hypothetical protein
MKGRREPWGRAGGSHLLGRTGDDPGGGCGANAHFSAPRRRKVDKEKWPRKVMKKIDSEKVKELTDKKKLRVSVMLPVWKKKAVTLDAKLRRVMFHVGGKRAAPPLSAEEEALRADNERRAQVRRNDNTLKQRLQRLAPRCQQCLLHTKVCQRKLGGQFFYGCCNDACSTFFVIQCVDEDGNAVFASSPDGACADAARVPPTPPKPSPPPKPPPVFPTPSKSSVQELKAELKARGIDYARGAEKAELVALLKAARRRFVRAAQRVVYAESELAAVEEILDGVDVVKMQRRRAGAASDDAAADEYMVERLRSRIEGRASDAAARRGLHFVDACMEFVVRERA